ncbi:IS66 family transposase, partial [Pandoraea sputorum]|uniref:IS66 family transposase n=1 Tax=Pandoraea sputorum TaxID=93222 RepID=UPI00177F51BE
MSFSRANLPDDIDALKALVLASQQVLHEREIQLAALQERLTSREQEIAHLKLLIAKLKRMQFGRKSEKLARQIEQLELRLEDLQADEGAAEAAAPITREAKPHTARQTLPEHLEREERVYVPDAEDCPQCGGHLKPLGEDVAEQLEYVRTHFWVIRHCRPKLACASCDAIVQHPAPSRPIERGLPGPHLLAHLITS